MNVEINNWRFEDGTTRLDFCTKWPLGPRPRGWYCWGYSDNTSEFLSWMKKNCPTADCIPRFNSGNPMITVYISDEKEATIFQLKWL